MIIVQGASDDDRKRVNDLLRELGLSDSYNTFNQPQLNAENIQDLLKSFSQILFDNLLIAEGLSLLDLIEEEDEAHISSQLSLVPDISDRTSLFSSGDVHLRWRSQRATSKDFFFSKLSTQLNARELFRGKPYSIRSHNSITEKDIRYHHSISHNLTSEEVTIARRLIKGLLVEQDSTFVIGKDAPKRNLESKKEAIARATAKDVVIRPPILLASPIDRVNQEEPLPTILIIAFLEDCIVFGSSAPSEEVQDKFSNVYQLIEDLVVDHSNIFEMANIFSDD